MMSPFAVFHVSSIGVAVFLSGCSDARTPATGPATSSSDPATTAGSGSGGASSTSSSSGTGGGYPAPVPDQATTYQCNPLHTGDQPGDTLAPPLTQRWTLDLHGAVSYPLIAEGRVFVTVTNADAQMVPQPGAKLFALDQATGKNAWGPVDLGGKGMSLAAYDDGHVFTVNSEGVVQSFDAATGQVGWSLDLDTLTAFTAPPVATRGNLYIVGGGFVSTFRQSTGQMLWKHPLQGGAYTSPVIADAGIYIAIPGTCVRHFNVETGESDWSVYANCQGNEGRTPALFDGLLYVRNPPGGGKASFLVDVAAQKETGTFEADVIPAFYDKRGFFLFDGALAARDLPSQTQTWSFKGDGKLVSAPIVANGNVYIGSSSGMLYALDAQGGNMVWSTDVGNPLLAPFESTQSPTIAGIAVGGGALIVPAWQHLAAYW